MGGLMLKKNLCRELLCSNLKHPRAAICSGIFLAFVFVILYAMPMKMKKRLPQAPLSQLGKNTLYAILLFLLLTAAYTSFTSYEKKQEISLSKLVEEVKHDEVLRITVMENSLEVAFRSVRNQFLFSQE